MLEVARPVATDPLFAERGVPERVPERRDALIEDLYSVSHEEQSSAVHRHTCARIVDGCHHRLAGARSGDKEVPVVPPMTRKLELVEHLFLERPENDLQR